MGKDIRIIQSDCDPSIAQDRTLPSNSFLVEYLQDGHTHFDIVTCQKQVEIFDEYWDKYRGDFINITQTEGRVNPKLWGYESKDSKKKKK